MSNAHATRTQPQQLAFSMPHDKRDVPNHLSRQNRLRAPNTSTQRNTSQQEDAYLCAWLRSRLDLPLLTLREESALVVTASDQAQVYRLAALARRRHLDLATGARVARTPRKVA